MEKTPLKWLKGENLYKKDAIYAEQFLYGEDGNYYVWVKDYTKGQNNCIYIMNEQKNKLEEKKLSYMQTQVKGQKVYPYISNIKVLENGNFLLDEIDNLILLDGNTGKVKQKITIDTMNDTAASYDVIKNEIIVVKEEKISFYEGENGKEEKNIDMDAAVSTSKFYIKEDNTLLKINNIGIQQLKENGSLWETTVDGELNSMSRPNFNVNSFYVLEGKKDKYLVGYSDGDGNQQIMSYELDESVASVPQEEITVYSLVENNTIRQAINVFHRENSNIKVNYIVSMSENGEKKADYIRALNTELLNGNGADVLVLDGLPVDSYVEKGVLLDLGEFYRQMKREVKIPDYIINSYKKDSKLFSLPCRFTTPIVYGKEKAVEEWSGLERILAYAKENKDRFYTDSFEKEQLLRIFLSEEWKQLLSKDGQFQEDKFQVFLEQVKQLEERLKSSSNKTSNAGTKGYTLGTDKLYDNSQPSYLSDLCDVALTQIGSIEDSMLFFTFIQNKKDTYKVVNNLFIPSGVVGINKASKKAELSKKFLKILFSDEVQQINVNDGFPVNETVLDNWFNKDSIKYSMAVYEENGERININWPNKDTRQKLYKNIKNAVNLFWADETLIDVLTTESLKYLEGKASLEQVSNSVQSKVNTYLSE